MTSVVMVEACNQHAIQVLTKVSGQSGLATKKAPTANAGLAIEPENVWMGTSRSRARSMRLG